VLSPYYLVESLLNTQPEGLFWTRVIKTTESSDIGGGTEWDEISGKIDCYELDEKENVFILTMGLSEND